MFDEASLPDHALMQDPAFAQALRHCGQEPRRLPCGQTLLFRRVLGLPLAMLPRAVPPSDLSAELAAIGLARTPVILSPDQPCRLPRALRLKAPRIRLVLSLEGDNADCRARLHPKWRSQLNQVEKRPVHVTQGHLTATAGNTLLEAEHRQARKRGYANWPGALTAAFAVAAPHQTHLFAAAYQGQTIAHMLFLAHGQQATYHIGHITSMGKKLGAHNLLLWRGARFLASRGHKSLDLGLLEPGNPGLNRFKLRTGAQEHITGGTWLYWRPFERPQSDLSAA